MVPPYNLIIIFNLDARYVWHLISEETTPTYRSSTQYKSEAEAKAAAYDFADKHNLSVDQVYYQ